MKKPTSLTPERALACTPTLDISQEWLAKKEAGLVPEGFAGMMGSLITVPAKEKLTREEAQYIVWLHTQWSLRGLAEELTGDDNQAIGMLLHEAAVETLDETPETE
jgi:hypothetical protein